MKVVLIKARAGQAAGTVVDLEAVHAVEALESGVARTIADHELITARETEMAGVRAREKQAGTDKIVTAVARALERGALLAKGELETSSEKVRAKFIGRYERNEASADICVEQIDALPKIQATEPERQTTSNGQRPEVGFGSGTVSGNELVKEAFRAMEPFSKSLRQGGIVKAAGRGTAGLVQAIESSREKTVLLSQLDKEMKGGFVVRAATLNYVDPAGGNPLGLLNTELMVLNNLGHLENQLAPIRDITTNIAGVPVAYNQQVRTRYFAIPKVQLKTDATAWAGGTGSNTDVNVKLDTYAGVEIAVGNVLLSSTPRSIFAEQHDPQLYGLGEYMLYKMVNTICNGSTRISNDDSTTATINFTNIPINIDGANLKTFVSDIPSAMDLAKMPGGDEEPGDANLMRYAWVHTRPYAGATADSNFVLNQSIQSIRGGGSSNGNVMETGRFSRLGNIKFRKSQMMTDQCAAAGSGTDGTTNGIVVSTGTYSLATTVGVAGTRSALLFVSRVPEDYTQVLPNIPSTAAVETVVSPQLGITFLVVKYLDHQYEIAKMRVQLMFGFAIGDERQAFLLQKTPG